MSVDDGKELMRTFQRTGDKAACRRLFELFREPLWRFLLRLCGSESDADDLSQRVWLKLIEIAEKGAYRPRRNATFKTYLFTVARNMFIDDSRLLRTRTVHVDASVVDQLSDTNLVSLEVIEDKQRVKARIRTALLQLPVDQREVLAMWAEGFSIDEVAAIVGARRNTVIGRKRYGIEKLRALLTKDAATLADSKVSK